MNSNKIKSVTAEVSYKYDLGAIHKTKQKIVFEFDQSGLVKSMLEITPFKNRIDSSVTIFIRNKSGQSEMIIKTDARYTFVEIMNYNSKDMVSHAFYQMKKTSDWSDNLYDEFLMWSDSIHYGDNKISIFNRYGKIYKKQIIERNERNEITKRRLYDQSGKWYKTVTYTYVRNNLTEIEEVNGYEWMFDWKKNFEYNKEVLLKIEYFKNNELEYSRKLSYDSNGLMELDLKRNELTKKMTILQFKYFR